MSRREAGNLLVGNDQRVVDLLGEITQSGTANDAQSDISLSAGEDPDVGCDRKQVVKARGAREFIRT